MVGISWIGAVSGQRQQAGGEHILQAPGQGGPFSSGQSLGPSPGSYVQLGLGTLGLRGPRTDPEAGLAWCLLTRREAGGARG